MNTRNNTVMVSALVAILIVSTAPFAFAQGPGHGQGRGRGQGHGDGGPGMPVERMAKHLSLSVEQVNSIKEIRESGRKENQELRKQMMRLRNEKRGEMLKDDPAAKKVLALTTELGDLRTRMQTNRMANHLEVRKVLTPEQRDKMLLSREGRGARKGRGHGERLGHGNQQDRCRGSNQGCAGHRRGND